MKKIFLLFGCLASFTSFATPLEISDAWIRSLPSSIPVRSGYLVIDNTTTEAINIVSVESEVFTQIEIHETIEKNGMMTMRPVAPLLIPANTTVKLGPGGLHLMMMNPNRELKPGDQVEIILRLVTGESQKLDMTVRK